jgi:hypothetical protein
MPNIASRALENCHIVSFNGGVHSPNFNIALIIPQIVYQTDYKLLFKGNFGFQAFVPFSLYASLQHNTINFATSGPGMGDLNAGVFLQWDPILLHGREFLVHRLELDVFFPIGKNKEPQKNINIGNGVYVINPYWAGTLFLQPKISISWRAHYAWISKNKKSGVQYGNALHANFDFSVEPYPKLWLGVCGYYLQQLKDNEHCGTIIPKSKGRTLGFGPGLLYFFPKDLEIFGYLYFEKKARNFSQGISFIMRLIKYF